MKSYRHLGDLPAAQPVAADDIVELHAGRLLLLLRFCGISNRIDGLTKLAKLDFFVRYPDAFNRMASHLRKEEHAATATVESPMVRHHYGPWDKRYYQVLAFLEGRNLIRVLQDKATFTFELSDTGSLMAKELAKRHEFAEQCEQMKRVKKLLGAKSGSAIKKLIYEVFREEVTERPLGEVIT